MIHFSRKTFAFFFPLFQVIGAFLPSNDNHNNGMSHHHHHPQQVLQHQ
jgi:hypothetical protein